MTRVMIAAAMICAACTGSVMTPEGASECSTMDGDYRLSEPSTFSMLVWATGSGKSSWITSLADGGTQYDCWAGIGAAPCSWVPPTSGASCYVNGTDGGVSRGSIE